MNAGKKFHLTPRELLKLTTMAVKETDGAILIEHIPISPDIVITVSLVLT